MTNAFARFLQTNPVTRAVQDYENVFDDFIAFAGGERVDANAKIPQGALNADYVLEAVDARLIIELKQVSKYQASNSVDEYFSDLLRRNRIRNPRFIGPERLHLDTESLANDDWERFYRRFRPQIPGALDKAARQVKATSALLPGRAHPTVGVAVLLNTGDFNLPVDLMFRIAERHARAKWKVGRFSALDVILCIAMDLVKSGQHPLHGRMMVRDANDPFLASAAHHLFDRWIHYGAAAIGAEVTFTPGEVETDPMQLSGGMTGKLHWTRGAATPGDG